MVVVGGERVIGFVWGRGGGGVCFGGGGSWSVSRSVYSDFHESIC